MQDPESDFDTFETYWYIMDTVTNETLLPETTDFSKVESTLATLRANSESKTFRAVRVERYTAEFYLNI
jgi:hypothetical protein